MNKNKLITTGLIFIFIFTATLYADFDVFSVNIFGYGRQHSGDVWLDPVVRETVTLESGQSAGVADWNTTGWYNYTGTSSATITSTRGSTATFKVNNVRNYSPYYWTAQRTTLLGDGNADMMDGHGRGTDDPYDGSKIFDMMVSDIPLTYYDVIIYVGSDSSLSGDDTAKIFLNGVEKDFKIIDTLFNGSFVGYVDATTPCNYILFEGVTGSSFTVHMYGSGFNHIGPRAIQFRAELGQPQVVIGDDWITWSGKTFKTQDASAFSNDPGAGPVTLEWTAQTSGGVNVSFSDTTVIDPNVTITKNVLKGNVSTVTLTLTASQPGKIPAQASKTIYVYDDQCEAALGARTTVIGPGDFNTNCYTDLEDFNILAQAWMIDYGTPELSGLSGTWLDGEPLQQALPINATVPDVTGKSESSAKSTLTAEGLKSNSTYAYDDFAAPGEVISQDPLPDSLVAGGSIVSLVVSLGLQPVTQMDIKEVYLAQNHVQTPDNPLFKLAGNRNAMLKVQVVGPEGTPAPSVTADISVGGQSTTLTLTGPSILPTNFQTNIGRVQHKHGDSFIAVIPAQWVQPGLSVQVNAGPLTVSHNIAVGAPTAVKMHMFDIHYFGLNGADYPAGTFEELESKWPVSSLTVERVYNINFNELVIPARGGAPCVRVNSQQDYYNQTGLNFDGEQAAALQWVHALSASGGNIDVAMQYINIIGVPAGGQAGGFDGVGSPGVGIFNHELGHALSLPHWGNSSAYPYKGPMYGIEPQPGNDIHVGPTWGFDIRSLTYLPPTVQPNTVAAQNLVGYYKKSPMWGGGMGDQEQGYLMRHFSDYGVNQMRNYLEGKVAVEINGDYYKWNDTTKGYTTMMSSNGVNYPIQQDVRIYSVLASLTLADINVNMVYPPIGPYTGNLIDTFDPTKPSGRAAARNNFAPSSGCDFTLRVVQGGVTSHYMLPASGTEGSDPYSSGSLKTAAVNLPASDGTITKVELLLTPDAEDNGLPADPQALYTWQ